MSHTVKIYDTCIGCTQCVRACPTDVLEMVPWDGCKSGQIASSPRVGRHFVSSGWWCCLLVNVVHGCVLSLR